MKTYLVIPDDDNGGGKFEMVCRALTPVEACEQVSEHLGHDVAVFYEMTAHEDCYDQGTAGGTTWVVRELPFMLNDRGVINWERFPAYVFTLGEHPEAVNEGIELLESEHAAAGY